MSTKLRNRKRFGLTAMLAFALTSTMSIGALAPAAHAQARSGLGSIVVTPVSGGDPPIYAPPSPTAPPAQYRVEAVKFYVVAESGDWGGSDEPYWIFSSVGADGSNQTKKSRTFSDVDMSEERRFSTSERCIFRNDCTGATAPNGIGMSIQLWEADSEDASSVLATTAKYFGYGGAISALLPISSWIAGAAGAISKACDYLSGWLKDDMLGTQTFTYSPALLANKLPTVGSSFTEARTFTGLDSSGGALYELVLKVSRVG